MHIKISDNFALALHINKDDAEKNILRMEILHNKGGLICSRRPKR